MNRNKNLKHSKHNPIMGNSHYSHSRKMHFPREFSSIIYERKGKLLQGLFSFSMKTFLGFQLVCFFFWFLFLLIWCPGAGCGSIRTLSRPHNLQFVCNVYVCWRRWIFAKWSAFPPQRHPQPSKLPVCECVRGCLCVCGQLSLVYKLRSAANQR